MAAVGEVPRSRLRETVRRSPHAGPSNVSGSRRFVGILLDGDRVDAVERLATRFLSGRDRLFAGRLAKGAVVDGHGDLLAEDIFCLPDGPRILDCIEFDDQLRLRGPP